MKIINFFRRRNYLIGLITIILNIYVFIYLIPFITKVKAKSFFVINIFFESFHFLICIFLESEFDFTYLRLSQFRYEKRISILSLIVLVFNILNLFTTWIFFMRYLIYKRDCPFNLSEFNYELHFKKRCELFNINKADNILQYICSYDAQSSNAVLFYLINKEKLINETYINCSKVIKLINNNEVIDKFSHEYIKEDLYYCDLVKLPENNLKPKDPYICQENNFFIFFAIILQNAFLAYHSKLNFSYFRNIRANVNPKLYHLM